MPRKQHTGPALPPVEHLNALAGLHASIRRGWPVTVGELHARAADAGGAGVDYLQLVSDVSQLSPDGQCAIIVWGDASRGFPDFQNMGAHIMARLEAGDVQIYPQPGSTRFHKCSTGFSACSRYCVVISAVGTAYIGGMPSLGHGESMDLIVHCFDTVQRQWLREVRVEGLSLAIARCISFSDGPGPMTAALSAEKYQEDSYDEAEEHLVTVQLPQLSFQVRATGACRHLWLPQTNCLVLHTNRGLARLTPASASGTADLAWVPLAPRATVWAAYMAAAPDLRTLWVVQTPGPSRHHHFSAHTCSDVAYVDRWTVNREVVDKQSAVVQSLQVSHRALAISCFRRIPPNSHIDSVSVFGLTRPNAVGPLLFRTDHLKSPTFSQDGCFVLGIGRSLRLTVLDARTGSVCVSLDPPAETRTGALSHTLLPPEITAAWSGSDPSQLFVTYPTCDGLLVCVLEF